MNRLMYICTYTYKGIAQEIYFAFENTFFKKKAEYKVKKDDIVSKFKKQTNMT